MQYWKIINPDGTAGPIYPYQDDTDTQTKPRKWVRNQLEYLNNKHGAGYTLKLIETRGEKMNQIEIKRARNAADYQRAKLYNKALAHFLTRARARNLDMQDLLDGILAM